MNRHETIRNKLDLFAKYGLVLDWQCSGTYPGLRWFVIAYGNYERGMTTNEVEWFIFGVESTLNWRENYVEEV